MKHFFWDELMRNFLNVRFFSGNLYLSGTKNSKCYETVTKRTVRYTILKSGIGVILGANLEILSLRV